MTLPISKLESLREIAEKATKGPWQTEGGMDLYVFTEGNEKMIAESRGTGSGFSLQQQVNNATHIAAFSPDVALALIDIVQAKKILDYVLIREALYAIENGDQYSKVLAIKHLKEALEGASE